MMMPSIWGESMFDGFFDDFAFGPGPGPRPHRRPERAPIHALMKTDVKESEAGFELGIELPGFTKDDIKAELKDGFLKVTATSKSGDDEKDENGKYIRRERFYGSCSRSYFVGKDLEIEDIKAKFENGILMIDVPKKQPAPEKNHLIEIAG